MVMASLLSYLTDEVSSDDVTSSVSSLDVAEASYSLLALISSELAVLLDDVTFDLVMP